jgi:hypothetical protein
MEAILPLILGAVGALLGWLTLEFLGRPLRNFFDLRTEAKRLLALHHDPDDAASRSTVQRDFRDIAAKLIAFEAAETPAAWLIRRLGFRPALAGAHFRNFADWWGEPHTDNEGYQTMVGKALRLGGLRPDPPDQPF